MDEKQLEYEVYCDVSMFDGEGAAKPDAYQRVCIGVVERHLNKIKLDVERLVASFGVSWVILGIVIEIERPFKAGETLTAQTWHTLRSGISYRRDMLLKDNSGEIIARAAVFSCLIDINSRKICTDKSVHEKIALPDGEPTIEASGRFKPNLDEFGLIEELKVRPSWIDSIGHVNNAKYGEFSYDVLSEEKRGRLGQLKRMEIYFTGELALNDSVCIKLSDSEDETVVAGIRESDGKQAYALKLLF